MKIKSLSRVNKPGSIIENLVDKSLGSAKRRLGNSDRQRSARDRSSRKELNECCSDFLADLPELMRPESAAKVLGVSIKTIYDWRYRSEQRKIPAGLFVKINRSLLIRASVFREWIASQNPSLQSERK
jgi:hypothetical protein